MKTPKLAIILTLVVACSSWNLGYAQDPPAAENQQKTPEISNTTYARGLLEIKNIPSSNTLFRNEDLLEILLTTTCTEQIAEKVFKKPFNEIGSNFDITCSLEATTTVYGGPPVPPSRQQARQQAQQPIAAGERLNNYLYNLVITIRRESNTPPMALELRQAAVQWLRDVILDEHQDNHTELADRIYLLTKDKSKAESELRALERSQREQIEAGGPRVLSRNRLQDEIRNLEQQKQRYEMDVYGADAREEALAEQIAKIGIQAEAKLADDPILEELEKLLDFRMLDLNKTIELQQEGAATEGAVNKSQEDLARAKIEIARRREQIGKTVGGNLLSKWNIELGNLALERAEFESKFSFVKKQLDEIKEKDLLTLAYRIENLDRDISNLRSTAANASEEIDYLQGELEQLESRKPKVNLLGDR
ncbi:hypothetical protein ACFL02_00685 [Planctomycetota bacterium]